MRTNDDIYDLLSEILMAVKESTNNRCQILEIDGSPENDLPVELDLTTYDNAVIKSMDKTVLKTKNRLTGKGKIKVSWKE